MIKSEIKKAKKRLHDLYKSDCERLWKEHHRSCNVPPTAAYDKAKSNLRGHLDSELKKLMS